MKITKSKSTTLLPETIAKCRGTVFMRFEDGQSYPVNEIPGVLCIFRKLWNCRDFEEVEFICENPMDITLFLDLMSAPC